jgi:hypothetical protein
MPSHHGLLTDTFTSLWICPVYDGVQNKPLMLHFLSFNGLSMYRVLHAVGNCDNVINHRPGASIFGVVRRKLSMSIRCRTYVCVIHTGYNTTFTLTFH